MAELPNSKNNEKAEKNGVKKKLSLVDALVKKAKKAEGSEENQEDNAQIAGDVRLAKTLAHLSIVVLVVSAAMHFVLLNPENPVMGSFGKQNLATEAERSEKLRDNTEKTVSSLEQFIHDIRIDAAAQAVVSISLNSTTEELLRSELVSISDQLNAIDWSMAKDDSKGKDIAASAEEMKDILDSINTDATPLLTDALRSKIEEMQKKARSVLSLLQTRNLMHLVEDLKRQAAGLELLAGNSAEQDIAMRIAESVNGISANQPSSIEQAFRAIKALPKDDVTSVDFGRAITNLTGDTQVEGDLNIASKIAGNVGAATVLRQLDDNRVRWSTALEDVRNILRFGADLKADDGLTTGAEKDIDIRQSLIRVTGATFSAKKEKEIVIRAEGDGRDQYRERNFHLLADVIDAFEASASFGTVDGFVFNKLRNDDGSFYTPINITISVK